MAVNDEVPIRMSDIIPRFYTDSANGKFERNAPIPRSGLITRGEPESNLVEEVDAAILLLPRVRALAGLQPRQLGHAGACISEGQGWEQSGEGRVGLGQLTVLELSMKPSSVLGLL